MHRHLKTFVKAVTENMAEYISIPGEEEAKAIAQRWKQRFCFPQAYGAIDGTHVPVTAPFEGYREEKGLFEEKGGLQSSFRLSAMTSACEYCIHNFEASSSGIVFFRNAPVSLTFSLVCVC